MVSYNNPMTVCPTEGNATSAFVRAAEYLLDKHPYRPNKLKDIDPEEIRREVLKGGGSYPSPAAERRPIPALQVDQEANANNTVAHRLRKFVKENGRHHKLKDLRLRFKIDKGRILSALGPCIKSGTVAVSPLGWVDVLDPEHMPLTQEEFSAAWVTRHVPKGLGLKAIQSLHAVGVPLTLRDFTDRLAAQNPGTNRGSLKEAIHRQTTRGCISQDANGLFTVSETGLRFCQTTSTT